MSVVYRPDPEGEPDCVELVDADGQPVPVVCKFLAHVAARGNSPNTVRAYAHEIVSQRVV